MPTFFFSTGASPFISKKLIETSTPQMDSNNSL
jgi:hypothetical protein